jgi:hypothetical protein
MPASIKRFWAVKLSMAMTPTSSSWADASWRRQMGKRISVARHRQGKPLIGTKLLGIPQSLPSPFMLGRTNHHYLFLQYLSGNELR